MPTFYGAFAGSGIEVAFVAGADHGVAQHDVRLVLQGQHRQARSGVTALNHVVINSSWDTGIFRGKFAGGADVLAISRLDHADQPLSGVEIIGTGKFHQGEQATAVLQEHHGAAPVHASTFTHANPDDEAELARRECQGGFQSRIVMLGRWLLGPVVVKTWRRLDRKSVV